MGVEVGGMWKRLWGGDFSRATAFSRQGKSPWRFPGSSDGKESVYNAGDPGSIPRSERSPWRREWLPTPALLPGEFHGQRSLVDYNPWGRKELATWWEEPTHWKSPQCWERLRAGGEGGDRGWRGWMASLTQQIRICTNSRIQWRTGEWCTAVHGVTKSRTQLSDWTTRNNRIA